MPRAPYCRRLCFLAPPKWLPRSHPTLTPGMFFLGLEQFGPSNSSRLRWNSHGSAEQFFPAQFLTLIKQLYGPVPQPTHDHFAIHQTQPLVLCIDLKPTPLPTYTVQSLLTTRSSSQFKTSFRFQTPLRCASTELCAPTLNPPLSAGKNVCFRYWLPPAKSLIPAKRISLTNPPCKSPSPRSTRPLPCRNHPIITSTPTSPIPPPTSTSA